MTRGNSRRRAPGASQATTATKIEPATILAPPAPANPHDRVANRWFAGWTGRYSYVLLTVLTLACLLPFCGKAIHIDDPTFIWSAQQILKHPLDPFGFPVNWDTTIRPMFEVTTNPPLLSYYIAPIGTAVGWSETALHLVFLLPALVVILGTYRLARRFTRNPLLAAASTLLTPGLLVSSTNVMCDTAMLALWILAVIFWLEGLDRDSWILLGMSALFIAASALTKYFGMALIPLLAVYSIARTRRAGKWILFLFVPVLILASYEHWTHLLYGKGLLLQAASDAYGQRAISVTPLAKAIIGLSFAGGCTLPALAFVPVLWSRRAILAGALIGVTVALCCANGWVEMPTMRFADNWNQVCTHLGFFVLGGIVVLALAVTDLWKRRDADSAFLSIWVTGTLAFATFINWAVNARSVMPLIPAAGILLARRFDAKEQRLNRIGWVTLLAPLAVAGLVSIWITAADAKWADSGRLAAQYIKDHVGDSQRVTFQGHWGFQYYMQRLGYQPVDIQTYELDAGNVIVVPRNSVDAQPIPPQMVDSRSSFNFDIDLGVTITGASSGAGFYADAFGPLPFAFGRAPSERYEVVRLRLPPE